MYTLSIIPYLEKCGNYTNIVVINSIPEGPLRMFVRRVQLPRLSPFHTNHTNNTNNNQSYGSSRTRACALALVLPLAAENRFVNVNDIPYLFQFLTTNGYKIDSNITNMMNRSDVRLSNETILCFIHFISHV